MIEFAYRSLPWNILFGAGALQRLPDALRQLGYGRALVLVTPNQLAQGRRIAELLGDLAVGVFDRAAMHVPAATGSDAIGEAERLHADCCVSFGGGSTTGLGKALALKIGLPNVAIPTTYSGSEMTNIWGITENDRKVTGRDDAVLPSLILYDPELTMALPGRIAGPSGINALAQAAVNITACDANPMVSLFALEAVRALAASLPRVVTQADDLRARADALYGASLAGAALGTGTTSLHHRLCHTFGGTFNTPHAETHTILLPHSVAYNAFATRQQTARLAEALGVKDAAMGIFKLAQAVGAPTALKDIGVAESDLDRAVTVATETPVNNPEPVTADRLRALLQNAFEGNPPQAV